MKNRILCALLCACIFVTAMFPVSVNAEERTNSNARLTYIAAAMTSIENVYGVANCFASFDAYPEVTKFNIKMYLEKKGFLGLYWSEVESTSHTFYVTSDVCERNWNFDGNGRYRVRAVYTAYCGTDSETITGYSGELDYKA